MPTENRSAPALFSRRSPSGLDLASEFEGIRRGRFQLSALFFWAVSTLLLGAGLALAQSPQVGQMPWSDARAEIEHCLAEGEVIARKALPVGITRPVKVTLDCGATTIDAVFKPLVSRVRQGAGWFENYRHEIAAYRLDRLLELDMVPPTLARKIGSQLGSLQFWVHGFSVYADNPDPGRLSSSQWAQIQTFDFLVNNPDRNHGNILIADDGRVALIDHSRASVFSPSLVIERGWRPHRRADWLLSSIAGLQREQLEASLLDVTNRSGVRQLMKRTVRLAKATEDLP